MKGRQGGGGTPPKVDGSESYDYGYFYGRDLYRPPSEAGATHVGTTTGSSSYGQTERMMCGNSEPERAYKEQRKQRPPYPAQPGSSDDVKEENFSSNFWSLPPVKGTRCPSPSPKQRPVLEMGSLHNLRAFTGSPHSTGEFRLKTTKSRKKKILKYGKKTAVKKMMPTAENVVITLEKSGSEGRRRCKSRGKSYQFTCFLCKFHTLYDEEMKCHLQSRFHKELFHYVEEKFSKQAADFLQEHVLHRNKKVEEQRGLIEDLSSTIHKIYQNQDLTQGLGMEHFLKKVEAAHCVACDKIIPMYCEILQQHINSPLHKQKCKIMMESSRETALQTARAMLNMKQYKQKLGQNTKDQNPFINDQEDNSRSVCSPDSAPEAQEPGHMPRSSLSNSSNSLTFEGKASEQSYKKEVKEEEDTPSGQDTGQENAEDCSYACEALDYAEVDAPQCKKTKMA